MGLGRIPLSIALLVAWAMAAAAGAQTTIRVPADQPTIQAAITAAHTGDTVLVAPGTYYENIDFLGKAITVTSSAGPATTIIDGGSGNAAVVTFQSSEPRTAILSNLTIQHGRGPQSVTAGSTGGIYISASSPTLSNNVITANACWNILANLSAPLIQGNEVSSAQASSACSGAGIIIRGNLNGANPAPSTIPLIFGNIVENNGALLGIANNALANGGGILSSGANPIIQGNIIRHNTALAEGGGIYIYGTATILQNLITNNLSGCGGGGIAFQGAGFVTNPYILIANNTLVDNTAQNALGNSECDLISQIYPDPAEYGQSNPQVLLVNNIISGSTTYPAIGCAGSGDIAPPYHPSETMQPIFDHNLLYNSAGAFFSQTCVDVSQKYNNLSTPPLFANPATGDYHLQASSPAIDSGNNSLLSVVQMAGTQLLTDLDGHSRLQDATGKNYPIIDMGSYEHPGLVDASPTTIVLTSSNYSGAAGSNYTLTAALASALGVPSGTVAFFLDGSPLGTSNISATGIATLSNFVMLPGVHALYATYAGQGSYPPAISIIIIVDIDPYTTNMTLSGSPNPALVAQSVTFAATAVSSDIHATLSPITLTDGSSTLATLTPNSSGVATFTISTLSLGVHHLTATYAGDASHASATASANENIINGFPVSVSLASSSNPSIVNQPVTFTATVTSSNGTPTGSITFTDSNTTLGTQSLDNSGHASFTTSTLAVGTHTITATYVPTGSFAASSGSVTQQVLSGYPTSIAFTATPNPAAYHQSVSLSAILTSLTATPLGTLTLADGTTLLASETITAPNWPALTFNSSTLSAGTHNLTATYTPAGNATTAGSSASVSLVIQPPPTTTTLTAIPTSTTSFQNITLTATVLPGAGAPGPVAGTVSFFSGATLLGAATLNPSGTASRTVNLPAGSYSLTAQYTGTASFAASTSISTPVAVNLADTIATIAAAPNPAVQRQTVTLSSTIVPTLAIPTLSGINTTPTGSVTFYDTGSLIATSAITASGTATAGTSALSPGTHQLSAVYGGDANFRPSVSALFTQTINPQDYTLSAPPLTIQTEHHAPLTVTITTVGALADTLTLSCTNLPQWANCYWDHPTLTLNAATSTYTTTVTIDTDEIYFFAHNRAPASPRSHLPIALATTLLGLAALRRRRSLPLRLLALTVLALSLSATLTGCSGQYPHSVTPGTYTLQINGLTSNTHISHSTNVPLTITP